jgi:hypothetical protein
MVRWIAFDDETADALVGKFKRGAAEIREGAVLDTALQHNYPSILIYPSTSQERVLLARVHSIPANVASVDVTRPLPIQAIRATGPSLAARRSWWRGNTA